MYYISRLRRVLSGGIPVVALLFYGKRFAVTGLSFEETNAILRFPEEEAVRKIRGEWITDGLHAMTFSGLSFLRMPPDRTDGAFCLASRKKRQTAARLTEDGNGKPLSIICPETGRSKIRGRNFSGSDRKCPDMFSVFSILPKSMPGSRRFRGFIFPVRQRFFQNRIADNASSRTVAGLPDASLAGSERICLNRLAPGRPVIMPSMWRVIPCIFRPFSP